MRITGVEKLNVMWLTGTEPLKYLIPWKQYFTFTFSSQIKH